MSNTIAKSSTMISIISPPETGRFATVQVAQSTKRILKILLQTIFQIAMSAWRFIEATTEVTSSGALVPNATIVSPMIDSDTQKLRAIFRAEFTKKSAQNVSPHKPRIINPKDFCMLIDSIELSSSSDEAFAIPNV